MWFTRYFAMNILAMLAATALVSSTPIANSLVTLPDSNMTVAYNNITVTYNNMTVRYHNISAGTNSLHVADDSPTFNTVNLSLVLNTNVTTGGILTDDTISNGTDDKAPTTGGLCTDGAISADNMTAFHKEFFDPEGPARLKRFLAAKPSHRRIERRDGWRWEDDTADPEVKEVLRPTRLWEPQSFDLKSGWTVGCTGFNLTRADADKALACIGDICTRRGYVRSKSILVWNVGTAWNYICNYGSLGHNPCSERESAQAQEWIDAVCRPHEGGWVHISYWSKTLGRAANGEFVCENMAWWFVQRQMKNGEMRRLGTS